MTAPRPLLAVPVLRIYDVDVARRFYLDFLGFSVVFEHRFEPTLPLYLRIKRGKVHLDLSEHHGDGTPGSVVWIATKGLREWQRQMVASDAASLRPGIDESSPGGPTMDIIDPFQNVLRICEPSDRV